MMKLFHAGNVVIREPDVHHGRKNADFGQGFYMTAEEEFARRWARERRNEKTYVNRYELDTEGLKEHTFERDEAWFRYIFNNRRWNPDMIDADVIIGPIANDTIYETFGIFTSGFLSDEEALRMLRKGPEYRQIVLKSKKASSQLTWLGADELTSEEIHSYRETVAKEEEEYIRLITEEMKR